MAWDSKKEETFSALEKLLDQKTNTLGTTGGSVEEPFRKQTNVILGETWRLDPTVGSAEELVAPKFDGYGVVGSVASRYESLRLHSYLPSGETGPNSCQTFIVVSTAPTSHAISDIDSVRMKDLIPPVYSPGKSDAAESDDSIRGFELALYPAACYGGVGSVLVPDLNKKIPTTADPSAVYGAGENGWSVDYLNGIVRLSVPPLNGPTGVFNPNDVFGDLEGNRADDAYGSITLFATFYQYSGSYGWTENQDLVTVGDGVISTGTYTGNSHNTIQSAIDSLPHGGTVFIKEGNYYCSSPIEVKHGIHLNGSNNTNIFSPAGNYLLDISKSQVSVSGINLFAPDGQTNTSLIRIGSDIDGYSLNDVSINNNKLNCKLATNGILLRADEYMSFKNLDISDNTFSIQDENNTVFIIGFGNRLESSQQLTAWTTATGISQTMYGGYFNGTLFCIVGATGAIYTSSDGVSWTARTADNSYGDDFHSVIYNGTLWCAVGETGEIQTSPDGETWTHRVADSSYIGTFYCVGFDSDGMFCVAGETGEIQTSTDGETWTHQTADDSFAEIFYGIVYGSNTWCLVGDSGEIQTSPDGETWTHRVADAGYTVGTFYSVAHNRVNTFMVVGEDDEIQISSDAVSWESTHSSVGTNFGSVVFDYGRNKWILSGYENNTIFTTTDGTSLVSLPDSNGTDVFGLMIAQQPTDPTFISVNSDNQSCVFGSLSIANNKFEAEENRECLVEIIGNNSSFEHINISDNIGRAKLKVYIDDAYMSSVVVDGNSFYSADVGRISDSVFSNNTIADDVTITAAINSDISHNIIGGTLDPTLENTLVFGNNITGDFKAEHVWNSSVSENIVGGALTIADGLTDGGTVLLDSKINSNTITGAFSIALSYTDSLTAPIIDSAVCSGNSAASFAVGSTSFDDARPSCQKFVFSDNIITGNLAVRGKTQESSYSGNQIFGSCTLEPVANFSFSDGYVGTTCAIGASITYGMAIEKTRIANNNFVGNVSLGISLIDGVVLSNANIEDNIMGASLAIASAAVAGSDNVVYKTNITGNTIAGNFTIGATSAGSASDIVLIKNSNISDNMVEGVLIFGSSTRNPPNNWTYYDNNINNNTIGVSFSMYGKCVSSSLHKNVSLHGAFTCGPLAHSVFSDGYSGSTITIGNTLVSGTAVANSDIKNNQAITTITVGPSLTSGSALSKSTFVNNACYSTLGLGTSVTSGDIIIYSSVNDNKATDFSIGVGLTGTTTGTVLKEAVVKGNWIDRHFALGNTSRDIDTETFLDSVISDNIIESNCTFSGLITDCSITNNSIGGTFSRDSISGTVNIIGNIGTLDGYISQNGDLNISAGTNDIILHSRVVQNGPDGSSVISDNGNLLFHDGSSYIDIKTFLLTLGSSTFTHRSPDNSFDGAFQGSSHSNGTDTWCLVGEHGEIQSSSFGYTWVHRTTDNSYSGMFSSICWGADKFCAVGSSGEIQTSPTSETWTHRTSDNSYSGTFQSVSHNGTDLWCVVGETGEIQTSPDGITWTHRVADSSYIGTFYGVSHNGTDLWCAVGADGEIQTSPDGETWTHRVADNSTTNDLSRVIHNGVMWCLIGDSLEMQTSFNGFVWASQSAINEQLLGINTNGFGLFIAVGNTGAIWISVDGIRWRKRHSGLSSPYPSFTTIAHNQDGMFIIAGTDGEILTSLRVLFEI